MLGPEQIKAIELLVTGHTISEVSREVGVTAQTVRNWMKNNSEFVQELSRATDIWAKECIKSRSRAYRTLNKKILDAIAVKLEEGELEELDLESLVKLLNKTVTIMRTDEDVKKMPHTAIQNNFQINTTIQDKLQGKEFAEKFSEFLCSNISSDDIEEIALAKQKLEESIETQQK